MSFDFKGSFPKGGRVCPVLVGLEASSAGHTECGMGPLLALGARSAQGSGVTSRGAEPPMHSSSRHRLVAFMGAISLPWGLGVCCEWACRACRPLVRMLWVDSCRACQLAVWGPPCKQSPRSSVSQVRSFTQEILGGSFANLGRESALVVRGVIGGLGPAYWSCRASCGAVQSREALLPFQG